jgi:lysophospholipase L1-like esterase
MTAGAAEFSLGESAADPEPTPYDPHTQVAFFLPQWNSDRGWFWWANSLSGWRAEVLNVSGVGGDRSDNLLQRIADVEMGVLPYEPAFCTVMIGVNDLNADRTASQVIANLEQIYRVLLDAGIGVVAMTILPVATGHFKAGNETHSQAIMAVNEWIRRTATRTPGMYLCDSCAAVVDPTAATFTTLSGMLASDGIHLTAKGARAVGAELSLQLQAICPPNGTMISSNRDSYGISSTNVQLIDNPLFTGSGGTAGSGMSGTIAASW